MAFIIQLFELQIIIYYMVQTFAFRLD